MAESSDLASARKTILRAQVKERRACLHQHIRDARGIAIGNHAWSVLAERLPIAGPVACTWSMPTEPPTDPLIARLQAAEIEVLTPRIVDNQALVWVPTRADTELAPGPLGIRTPIGPDEVDLATCAVIFVPALALDRRGTRLGQGGGYFDRALSALPPSDAGGPLRIGVAYANEVVDELPRQEHDQGVDLIVTESGVIPVASR